MPSRDDADFYCARRYVRDGRVLIVPPEGHGDAWSGGRTNAARVFPRGRDGRRGRSVVRVAVETGVGA